LGSGRELRPSATIEVSTRPLSEVTPAGAAARPACANDWSWRALCQARRKLARVLAETA